MFVMTNSCTFPLNKQTQTSGGGEPEANKIKTLENLQTNKRIERCVPRQKQQMEY